MRCRLLLLLLVAGALVAGCTGSDDVLVSRPYEVHVPPGYRPREHAPLLMLLHGYGQTGDSVAAYFDVLAVTDANRMLFVAPDGTTDDKGKQYWHATGACCGPPDSTVDDLGYLRAVLKDVRRHYLIDPKRIYFMGHSNGAFMSYQMACHNADVVAAIVAYNGSMTVGEPCNPSEPVAVAQIHGTEDEIIRYGGGHWKESTHAYMSAPDSVLTWAELDGCATTPEQPPPASHDLMVGGPPAPVTAYGTCRPGGAAELWTQPGGDHDFDLAPTFSEQAIAFMLAHPKP